MTVTKQGPGRAAGGGRRPRSVRKPEAGFSMIEMVVSVALGLMVTSAVLYTVTGTNASGRKQETQARMYDAGQMTLAQMAEHLRMAGFWMPDSEVASGDVMDANGSPLKGCRGSAFAAPTADWDSLACTTGGQATGTDTLAMRFQVQPVGRNWDCAGNSVMDSATVAKAQQQVPPGGTAWTAPAGTSFADYIDQRFYVRTSGTPTGNPALYCQSMAPRPGQPAGSTPVAAQLMADNVEHFQVDYAVSPTNPDGAKRNMVFDPRALLGRSTQYLKADQLDPNCVPGSMPANSWCAVNAVRICVLMRSEDNVNDQSRTPYVNCDGEVRTANDRRMRQAFSMTVAIRNRNEVAAR